MSTSSSRVSSLAAAVLVVAGAAWLLAGPLNPPTGPVSAGGKTTQEIYDAVTGISSSIGAVGGRGPAVPGGNGGSGTLAVAGASPVGGSIIGMRLSVAAPVPSTGTGGRALVQGSGITVVREASAGSANAWKLCVNGTHVQTATITMVGSAGTTTYLLNDVVIIGYRDYFVQRSDGTFGAIEELDLYPVDVRVTDPSGTSYHWNFSTNLGGV
jgi:hypothetical protein